MFRWVLPPYLARASRPGYGAAGGGQIPQAEMERWVEEVAGEGIKSIICLLTEEHLRLYQALPIDLLAYYRECGFYVQHVPVADYQQPPVSGDQLYRIWEAYQQLPKPVLIHCSAGIDRTGQAVEYVLDRLSTAEKQVVNTSLETAIHHLERSAEPALKAQQELRGEIERLFKTVRVDPSMSVARARCLLEVMIKDYYISRKSLVPPYGKLKDLFNLIEELTAGNELSRVASALCHAVRIEGNRVLHYRPERPGDPKWAEMDDVGLAITLRKLLEVAEMMGTGGHSVYLSSLAAPFPSLYEWLIQEWKPMLEGKHEEQFPLFEALDLLFRSIVAVMRPEWWPLVERYANDNALPEQLATEEEHALRQLRNLGLIQHDGQWLFTPTRSRRIWPTSTGTVFLALSTQAVCADSESVAREVVKQLNQAVSDQAAIDLLEKVRKGQRLAREEERTVARRLRNHYLVTHETYFLASAEKLRLTDLGYYVLGKCSPD